MLDALRFFAYFGGYGWGIVWLTIAVNLALYPLTLTSVKSMGAIQRIQPKLAELQKKYKDKPQEMQKATMDLYRSEGVNPFGGCLPVLLKIPFFLALFWAFQSTAFLGIASNPNNNTSFLWVTGRVSGGAFQSESLVKKLEGAKLIVLDENESQKTGKSQYVWNAVRKFNDKIVRDILRSANEEKVSDRDRVREELGPLGKEITQEDSGRVIAAWNATNNLAKPDRVNTPVGRISILALLVGITTYLMQKSLPAGGGQQAQMMTMFMPIFIVFICWNFPVGVQLYWLVSNFVGAVQQYYILKAPKHRPKRAAAKH
jgi:YidC/Oxa1 family membrane protein insertase